MKLRSGRIVGLGCLNVRVLRSGREILTMPAKSSPKTKPVVNRVRFTTETRFNEREGFLAFDVYALSDEEEEFYRDFVVRNSRKGKSIKRKGHFYAWVEGEFGTVLEYCRYMDG